MAKKQDDETQATEEVVEAVEEAVAEAAPQDPHGFFAQQQAICFGKGSL